MICSHLKTILWSSLLLTCSLVDAQQLSKPALRPNLDDFTDALDNTFRPPDAATTLWSAGTIAEPCKFEAQQNGYDPNEMWIYNVTYTDCQQPYAFCIHKKVKNPVGQLIDLFGKVPPRMRQYVRTISFFPDIKGAAAYARGADIVIFGAWTKVGIYLHELMHAAEYSNAFKSNAAMTDQAPWQNAYNADTAVPNDYARSNQHENLAEQVMTLLYKLYVGDPRKLASNYDRIINQQNVLQTEADQGKNQGKLFARSGVECVFRHPFPPKVDTKVTKRTTLFDRQASALSNYELSKIEFEPLGIKIIDPKTLPTGKALEITKCQFH